MMLSIDSVDSIGPWTIGRLVSFVTNVALNSLSDVSSMHTKSLMINSRKQ